MRGVPILGGSRSMDRKGQVRVRARSSAGSSHGQPGLTSACGRPRAGHAVADTPRSPHGAERLAGLRIRMVGRRA